MQLGKRSGLFWSKLVATHGRVKVVICEMVSSNQKFQMSGSLDLDLCMKDWRMTTNKMKQQKPQVSVSSKAPKISRMPSFQSPPASWPSPAAVSGLRRAVNTNELTADTQLAIHRHRSPEIQWDSRGLPCGIMSTFETQAKELFVSFFDWDVLKKHCQVSNL